MNTELWEKIERFDLDYPISEYGFSTRLAHENTWTRNFTQKAITEYKKFMYLAATSSYMVSPSEIVDVVWHQHLIFTQSYKEFCIVLGKNIHHIPSTHNRNEAEKFALAKERTKKLYSETFGGQPVEFWQYENMLDSLGLKALPFGIATWIALIIAGFTAFSIPLYYLLKPVYVTINNPNFLLTYVVGFAALVISLLKYNRTYLDKVMDGFRESSFAYHLAPYELIYMLSRTLSAVTGCIATRLINEGNLERNSDRMLTVKHYEGIYIVEDFVVMETVKANAGTEYANLPVKLASAPVFTNMAATTRAFRKHFFNSRKFAKLFFINFCSLLFVFLLGLVRLILGITRDKPILFISIVMIALVIIAIAVCKDVFNRFFTDTVPQRYKNAIVDNINVVNNWEWQYFLKSPALVAPAFMVLVANFFQNSGPSNHKGGSSGGGSCGGGGGGGCGAVVVVVAAAGDAAEGKRPPCFYMPGTCKTALDYDICIFEIIKPLP